LTECFESAGGNAAAATFIIVDDSLRGKGLGRQLMEFLEEEAKRLGYHYLYLWTKTAIPFYQKIGYRECQRVSLKRACLKVLQESQVETLEAVLFRKTQQQQRPLNIDNHQQPQGRPKKQRETVLLPPTKEGEDDTAADVWLRKRLLEHVGSRQVPLSERLDEMKEIIAGHVGETRHWRYFLLSLPWQAQVGPSCGLAALRMIHEYYLFDRSSNSNASNHDAIDEQIQRPSLLGEAQERGYTQDGEVFNANHLLSLARDACGLKGEMCSPQTLQPQQIGQTLWDGGVFVLPYDSNPRTRLPALLSGKNAHYGIIVGILAGWKLDTIGSTGMDEPVLDSLDDVAALAHCDKELFYVLVQHSLSPKLSVAPLSAFVSSNQQLDTADDNKFEVQELDLKDRIILLRGI
jgi:predicted GNAT family acetyltransferase